MAEQSRRYKWTDPEIEDCIRWFETEHAEFWSYYLSAVGLKMHLGKYMAASPFPRGNAISWKFATLIMEKYKGMPFREMDSLRMAVQEYIPEKNLVGMAFEFHPAQDKPQS